MPIDDITVFPPLPHDAAMPDFDTLIPRCRRHAAIASTISTLTAADAADFHADDATLLRLRSSPYDAACFGSR